MIRMPIHFLRLRMSIAHSATVWKMSVYATLLSMARLHLPVLPIIKGFCAS